MRHLLAALSAMLIAAPVFAATPQDGALNFQPAATRIAERVHEFHTVLLWIITLITALVTVLLVWVMIRYSRAANKTPRKFSHNTTVEVIWTVVPALILVGIASLSFPNLFYQNVTPNLGEIAATSKSLLANGKTAQHLAYTKNYFPDAAEKGFINVKVQGNQWNWTYTYPDIVDESGAAVEFVSNGIHKGRPGDKASYEANTGRTDFDTQPVNLAVDYPMVVPAGRYVRYYTAAADVIHSFTIPSFSIKTDAIPGRLNEGWFLVEEPGVYYGQCSELCGIDHAYMPIEVRVVPQAQYDRWAELMKAGDFDAAVAAVTTVAALEADTKFASNN
ncbi:cytochrome c oxidase subunit II [Hyphomonas sp.]|uniref:cytochrome c oxidase subunit II n=1 Tax=Hyphomonas sp. TaxID=87 RepID=UPI00391A25C1